MIAVIYIGSILFIALFVIIAYFIGSILSAVVVCSLWGLPDPLTHGSHNPGATNVLRIGGRIPALLTLCGDVLKSTLVVAFALWMQSPPEIVAAMGFAVFLGHIYPIYNFSFAGGKGVATALGIWLALSWQVTVVFLSVWVIVALLFRYASLASIVASLVLPFYMWYAQMPVAYIYLASAIAIIITLRHRGNLVNIAQGKENKLFVKDSA